jgi:hypothetical protein
VKKRPVLLIVIALNLLVLVALASLTRTSW